ncbi:AAA family ATPase [Paenibacillus sp. 19GGS1-52]|uniref:AAA family ATPase n=1 Tax=Paenibacillus sp. 19GGS1-52 TaxID=2758563 RepID=UPI001EFAF11E|nr:AAA family ATPase [Paenibacillus sp. 19GGS1-52]ULO07122.1 AAA family ATPase [Paenibacillus sp. 19GGS1-52]
MPEQVFLDQLERDGFCSTTDIENDYSKSFTVQNDRLDLLSNDDLKGKIREISQNFAISSESIYSIYYGLIMGNVILEGPPGTGKTTLAKVISEQLFNVRLVESTANIEWTVYDLVGRKTLEIVEGKEQIVPENGHITKSIIECCHQISRHEENRLEPQAEWLLIDEINRCKIDRAFGEFFTVLGSTSNQSISLSHQYKGNQKLYIPKKFRIIGTMNSVDKSYVNSFSQAFARRFHFVAIDIPKTEEMLARERSITLDLAIKEVLDLTSINKQILDKKIAEVGVSSALDKIDSIIHLLRFGDGNNSPAILSVGTAQIIDIKKAFLLKLVLDSDTEILPTIVWAISTKLLAQLDSTIISEEAQLAFINAIPNELKGIKDDVQRIWGFYEGTEI